MDVTVEQGTVEDVDALSGLWLQMLAHHRAVIGGLLPVNDDDRSWAATATEYRGWFEAGNALLLARAVGGEVVGYLACHLDSSTRTFDIPRMGHVDSLVVAADARGAGVGSLLLEACKAELLQRDIRFWSIGVVEGNDRAMDLYERFGFRPFYRDLAAEIG